MENSETKSNNEKRVIYLEEHRRYIQNSLELALTLGDFQNEINNYYLPEKIFKETEIRINSLIEFEARAFYFVDQKDSDLILELCEPPGIKDYLEDEIDFIIDKGFMAWAMRERRGITVLSSNKKRQIFLHVVSTYSRIRGVFVGLFKENSEKVPDVSLQMLSLILRNAANAIESIEYYNLIRNQKHLLEIEIEQKTKKIQQYERQLLQAQKMEAVATLAGGVAHDLNNVLSGIVSYPDLLLMDLPDDSPMRQPIEIIQDSGKKAAAIVQDLLTLARRGVSVSEIVNLNNIVDEYLVSPELQKLKAYHPLFEVVTYLDASLLNIMGSPVHLSKTVMNIVSNAAEAMPDGGSVIIKTENKYIAAPVAGYDEVEKGDYVVLTVSDSGIGIDQHEINRIFEPFFTKKVMGRSGTGLGMAVVWGTVKDHKGYISVESSQGKGTTFKLFFPATHEKNIGKGKKNHVKEYRGNGERILVVDDVKEQREIASRILFQLNYKVETVSSGEEAVEYVDSKSVDLVILDMIMAPGIDGLETYRRILDNSPGQKAIITSGFSETEKVKEAQRLGAGEYIKKPYSIEEIGLAVKNELSGRKHGAA
jgi:signal transduction histidine kinase/ActR/RegA family two-component response regulator